MIFHISFQGDTSLAYGVSHSNSQKVSYLGRKSGNALQKGLLSAVGYCRGTRGIETSWNYEGSRQTHIEPIIWYSKALASILILNLYTYLTKKKTWALSFFFHLGGRLDTPTPLTFLFSSSVIGNLWSALQLWIQSHSAAETTSSPLP